MSSFTVRCASDRWGIDQNFNFHPHKPLGFATVEGNLEKLHPRARSVAFSSKGKPMLLYFKPEISISEYFSD